jgi:hypothetical protein
VAIIQRKKDVRCKFFYKNGDHPWEDLAKSGYKPHVECKSFNHPFIFMATHRKPTVKTQ